MDAGAGFRVGGDDQIQVAPGQRRQRQEGEAGGQIQFHFGPVLTEVVDGGHQPVEAAVALDADVEASGGATGQASDVTFGAADHRQQIIGQGEQALAGTGEADRLGLADEQGAVEAFFQVFDLMGEGRLRQMDPFGGFDKAACIAQGRQCFQVT